MSFVNDVMSEEADRKGLILFEDYSIIKSIDLPPIHDNANVKKKYWINFLLVLIAIVSVLKFVDQLPVTDRSIAQNTTRQPADIVTLVAPEKPIQIQAEIEPITKVTSIESSTKVAIPSTKRTIKPVAETQSQAEIKLKNTQVEFEATANERILDLSKQKVIFQKKIVTEQLINNQDAKYQHAQQLLRQGLIAKAIGELQQILVQNESLLEPRLLLASTLLENKQKQSAIDVYKKGLIGDPNEARLAQPLAHLLVNEGQPLQALHILNKAAPDHRVDPEYHSMMAALYQQSGKHEQAIAVYQKILNLQSNNGKWWLGLGISLMAKSQNKQALSAFEWSLLDERVPVALKQFAAQRINDLKNRGSL